MRLSLFESLCPFICWTFVLSLYWLCWTELFGFVVWFVRHGFRYSIFSMFRLWIIIWCVMIFGILYHHIVWYLSQCLNYMWLCLMLLLMLPSLCFEASRTYVWCIFIQMQITYMHTCRGSASMFCHHACLYSDSLANPYIVIKHQKGGDWKNISHIMFWVFDVNVCDTLMVV
jgi:hypothetical protein